MAGTPPDDAPISTDLIDWPPRRKELLEWFGRQAPSLGELYEGAAKMMCSKSPAGRTRFIAHAIREICNRLPNVISGEKAGGNLQYKNRIDDIGALWDKHVDASLVGGVLPDGKTSVELPRIVFDPLAKLLQDHKRARERRIEGAIRLFESLSPENERLRDALLPIVKQWAAIGDWAVGKAHDSGATDDVLENAEFQKRFELFEDTLCALVRGFYSTIEGLDEILEDTNS